MMERWRSTEARRAFKCSPVELRLTGLGLPMMKRSRTKRFG
jgi:hypothetical protein